MFLPFHHIWLYFFFFLTVLSWASRTQCQAGVVKVNIFTTRCLQQDSDLTRSCFRKTVVGHTDEGRAGDTETAQRTEESTWSTTSHPSSRHSVTAPHPPSPPVTPLPSPYSSAPCGLHFHSPAELSPSFQPLWDSTLPSHILGFFQSPLSVGLS